MPVIDDNALRGCQQWSRRERLRPRLTGWLRRRSSSSTAPASRGGREQPAGPYGARADTAIGANDLCTANNCRSQFKANSAPAGAP